MQLFAHRHFPGSHDGCPDRQVALAVALDRLRQYQREPAVSEETAGFDVDCDSSLMVGVTG